MALADERRAIALEHAARRASELAALLDDGVQVSTEFGWSAALVCAFFGVRTSRALSAVVHLCQNSFGVESQAILRNMLQDLVDVRFMATSPGLLCEQWREHESRRRYYTYVTRRELQEIDEPGDFAELQALIERDWDGAKRIAAGKLHKDAANVSRTQARKYLLKDRWTRLSIRETAQKATEKYPDTAEHFGWYPYLSEHAHGSPGLAGDYLQSHDSQVYLKDFRDPHFKSASMAVSGLVYAHATFVGLRDIGLKYDPAPLIENMPLEGLDLEDL